MIRRPQSSTLFPYTPLFRSIGQVLADQVEAEDVQRQGQHHRQQDGEQHQAGELVALYPGFEGLHGMTPVNSGEIGGTRGIRGQGRRRDQRRTLEANRPWGRSIRMKTISDSVITDRKSTRLNSSHLVISYAVFCLKK